MERLPIEPFDPQHAGAAELAAWTACANRLQAEALPDDPPLSEEATRRALLGAPEFREVLRWTAWSGAELVAQACLTVEHTGDNLHLADFEIGVLPERRRRGIGTRLLREILAAARERGRSLLVVTTVDAVPAGEAFLRALGASPRLTEHLNQLDLQAVDRSLLDRWHACGEQLRRDFEPVRWDGPYPEEALAEAAAMQEAGANLIPRGDLDQEDERVTPEQLRQRDAAMLRRGTERWTLAARDRASGRIAGYTEVFWNPDTPQDVEQGDTVVFPEFRNRGLARWLKALMLERVLRERPQARWARTENAVQNAPMQKINRELGFRPVRTLTHWQVELAAVERFLAARAATAPPAGG